MLTPRDYEEFSRLLRAAMSGALTMEMEHRLRFLLAREDPEAAIMSIPELIDFGLLIGGLFVVVQGIQSHRTAGATA